MKSQPYLEQYELFSDSGISWYSESMQSLLRLSGSGKQSVVMGNEAGMMSDFQSTPTTQGQVLAVTVTHHCTAVRLSVGYRKHLSIRISRWLERLFITILLCQYYKYIYCFSLLTELSFLLRANTILKCIRTSITLFIFTHLTSTKSILYLCK